VLTGVGSWLTGGSLHVGALVLTFFHSSFVVLLGLLVQNMYLVKFSFSLTDRLKLFHVNCKVRLMPGGFVLNFKEKALWLV